MRLAQNRRRAGFTLVELMVAAGLTILIMTVMASGFQMALQSFSTLKAAGDLADRIRTAEALLRQDLAADHFDDGTGGLPRLSDFRFDRAGTPEAVRPVGGFFQIRQGAASVLEGGDQDNLSSTRAPTSATPGPVLGSAAHTLSMTVRRTGKSAGDLFAVVDPNVGTVLAQPRNQTDVAQVANSFLSEWAEVHWFLDTTRPTMVNGVATFPLCRRVRLLTRQSVNVPAATHPTLAEVVSVDGASNTNTVTSVTAQANRLGLAALPGGSNRFGDDIVITNVLSFEVKPTWEVAAGGAVPRTNVGPVGSSRANADYPFDDLPANNVGPLPVANVQFDSALGGFATAAGAPVTPARVTGAQIKIRIYDGKNKMTRQSTVTGKL